MLRLLLRRLRYRFFNGLFFRLAGFLFRRCLGWLLLRGRYLACRNGQCSLSGFRLRRFGFRSKEDNRTYIGAASLVVGCCLCIHARTRIGDPFGGDTLPYKVAAHGAGASQRERIVEHLPSACVRPAGNDDPRIGIRLGPAHQPPRFRVVAPLDPLPVAGREIECRAHHHRIAFSRAGNDIPVLRY